jgi:hypothetical protein
MCHEHTDVVFRTFHLLQGLHSARLDSITSRYSNVIDVEEASAGCFSHQLGSPRGPHCTRKFTRRNRVQGCTDTEHCLSYSQLLRNQNPKYGKGKDKVTPKQAYVALRGPGG